MISIVIDAAFVFSYTTLYTGLSLRHLPVASRHLLATPPRRIVITPLRRHRGCRDAFFHTGAARATLRHAYHCIYAERADMAAAAIALPYAVITGRRSLRAIGRRGAAATAGRCGRQEWIIYFVRFIWIFRIISTGCFVYRFSIRQVIIAYASLPIRNITTY